MNRQFKLRDAFLVAVLLHALLFVLDWWMEGRLAGMFSKAPDKLAEQRDPMKFRFVDVPEEEEQKPEPSKSRIFSDRELRARSPEPRPERRQEEQPRVTGLSPYEFTLPSRPLFPRRAVPPTPPEPPEEEPTPLEPDDGERRPASRQPEFRKRIDTFIENLVAEGYRNPDGSVSALGHPTFDTVDFNFGPYARRLYWKVRSNWHPSPTMAYLGKTWEAVIEFDILKDGTVDNLRVIRESGIPSYDRESLYAILASYPLEPLPGGYPYDQVGVRWHFYYHVYY